MIGGLADVLSSPAGDEVSRAGDSQHSFFHFKLVGDLTDGAEKLVDQLWSDDIAVGQELMAA